MDETQEYLTFENHEKTLVKALSDFYAKNFLVNVTLVCGGEKIKAHQTVLSACSSLFENIFRDYSENHPVIVFQDVPKDEMVALLEFMYRGHVSVPKKFLPTLLKTAKNLQIRGLQTHQNENFENTSQETNNDETQVSSHSIVFSQEPEVLDNVSKEANFDEEQMSSSTPLKVNQEPEKLISDTVKEDILKSPPRTPNKSSPMVINPFAKNTCEKSPIQEKVQNLDKTELRKFAELPQSDGNDTDVEVIEDYSVIEIKESQNDNGNNTKMEWLRKSTRGKKRLCEANKVKSETSTRKKTRRLRSVSEESDSTPELISNPGTSKEINNGHNKSDGHNENDVVDISKMAFSEITNYCVICDKFYNNLQKHFKKYHKKISRLRNNHCKKCSSAFFEEKMLQFHKCV